MVPCEELDAAFFSEDATTPANLPVLLQDCNLCFYDRVDSGRSVANNFEHGLSEPCPAQPPARHATGEEGSALR